MSSLFFLERLANFCLLRCKEIISFLMDILLGGDYWRTSSRGFRPVRVSSYFLLVVSFRLLTFDTFYPSSSTLLSSCKDLAVCRRLYLHNWPGHLWGSRMTMSRDERGEGSAWLATSVVHRSAIWEEYARISAQIMLGKMNAVRFIQI